MVMVHLYKSLCTVEFHSIDGVDFRKDLEQILSPAAPNHLDSQKILHLEKSNTPQAMGTAQHHAPDLLTVKHK